MNAKVDPRLLDQINLIKHEHDRSQPQRHIAVPFQKLQERMARAHRFEGKKSHSRRELKFTCGRLSHVK